MGLRLNMAVFEIFECVVPLRMTRVQTFLLKFDEPWATLSDQCRSYNFEVLNQSINSQNAPIIRRLNIGTFLQWRFPWLSRSSVKYTICIYRMFRLLCCLWCTRFRYVVRFLPSFSDETFLYVIHHGMEESDSDESVEKFAWNTAAGTLTHVRTIKDPSFTSWVLVLFRGFLSHFVVSSPPPHYSQGNVKRHEQNFLFFFPVSFSFRLYRLNDLIMTGLDTFYVTNDYRFRNNWIRR